MLILCTLFSSRLAHVQDEGAFEIASQGSQDSFSFFRCYATWLSTVVQLLMTQLLTQIIHFPEMLDFSHISFLFPQPAAPPTSLPYVLSPSLAC